MMQGKLAKVVSSDDDEDKSMEEGSVTLKQ